MSEMGNPSMWYYSQCKMIVCSDTDRGICYWQPYGISIPGIPGMQAPERRLPRFLRSSRMASVSLALSARSASGACSGKSISVS